jgi:hypothetical protein
VLKRSAKARKVRETQQVERYYHLAIHGKGPLSPVDERLRLARGRVVVFLPMQEFVESYLLGAPIQFEISVALGREAHLEISRERILCSWKISKGARRKRPNEIQCRRRPVDRCEDLCRRSVGESSWRVGVSRCILWRDAAFATGNCSLRFKGGRRELRYLDGLVPSQQKGKRIREQLLSTYVTHDE